MRSEQHLTADELQEKIVMRGRSYQLWVALIVLAVGAAVAGYYEVSPIWIMVGTVGWAVSALHISFTATLGELYVLLRRIKNIVAEATLVARDFYNFLRNFQLCLSTILEIVDWWNNRH